MTTRTKSAAKSVEPADKTPSRRRLLEAATAAFAQGGYEGARINDIATRAKANKQLVYHYFGSKEGLYRAVIEELYEQYRGNEAALERIENEPDPEVAIRKLAKHLFKPGDTQRGFQRLLQDLNQRKRRHLLTDMKSVQASYARLISVVSKILSRGENNGLFKSGINPKEFYVTLTGACSVRIYNATTLSFMLDMDLETRAGADASHDWAVSLIIDGLRRHA